MHIYEFKNNVLDGLHLKVCFWSVCVEYLEWKKGENTTNLKFSPFCNRNGQPFKVVYFHNTNQYSSSKQRYNFWLQDKTNIKDNSGCRKRQPYEITSEALKLFKNTPKFKDKKHWCFSYKKMRFMVMATVYRLNLKF